MRRFFILFSIISVLSLIQGILYGFISIGGLRLVPDFSMIFLVLFSIEFGRGVGQSAGFLGGLLEDFAMAKPLGYTALIKMFIGSIFGMLQGRFVVGMLVMAVVSVIFATIIKYVLAWSLAKLLMIETFLLVQMGFNLLIEIVLNAVMTIPAYWLAKKILKSVAEYIRREQKI